jgi:hypothetical protein
MIVADLQIAVADAFSGLEQLPKALRRLLEEEAWRHFQLTDDSAIPGPEDAAAIEIEYEPDQFEDFCAAAPPRGLGISADRLMHLTASMRGKDAEVALQLMRELLIPLQPHGGQLRDAAARREVATQPRIRRGAAYALRRLKRDHPTAAEEVVAGELSANAAAVRAGHRQRYLRIPANPWRAAEKLRAQGPEWITELVRALERFTADQRRHAESAGGHVANLEAGTDRAQIELPLTDRNHEPTISVQMRGEWLVPPEDPIDVPSSGAELSEIARVSVARLNGGALLAYVRVLTGGDAHSTMALIFGDPSELVPQNLPLDLVNKIEVAATRPLGREKQLRPATMPKINRRVTAPEAAS